MKDKDTSLPGSVANFAAVLSQLLNNNSNSPGEPESNSALMEVVSSSLDDDDTLIICDENESKNTIDSYIDVGEPFSPSSGAIAGTTVSGRNENDIIEDSEFDHTDQIGKIYPKVLTPDVLSSQGISAEMDAKEDGDHEVMDEFGSWCHDENLCVEKRSDLEYGFDEVYPPQSKSNCTEIGEGGLESTEEGCTGEMAEFRLPRSPDIEFHTMMGDGYLMVDNPMASPGSDGKITTSFECPSFELTAEEIEENRRFEEEENETARLLALEAAEEEAGCLHSRSVIVGEDIVTINNDLTIAAQLSTELKYEAERESSYGHESIRAPLECSSRVFTLDILNLIGDGEHDEALRVLQDRTVGNDNGADSSSSSSAVFGVDFQYIIPHGPTCHTNTPNDTDREDGMRLLTTGILQYLHASASMHTHTRIT